MEPYSEHNPVPTTQKYLYDMAEREKSPNKSQAQAPSDPSSQQSSNRPKGVKQDMMQKMTGPKEKPTEKVGRHKGEHVVKDPITGTTVTTRDADFNDLREDNVNGVSASHPGNITRHPYLPARPVSLTPFMRLFDQLQLGLTFSFAMIWFLLAFPPGRWWLPFTWPWLVWLFRTSIIGVTAFVSVTTVNFVKRRFEKEVDHIRADMSQERGQKFTPPIPESVEWMNMFLQTLWALINPESFADIADMIEDVMQQSLPAFVDAVRVSDMGQGMNPIRILSVRALSDKPTDKEYPRDDWIDQGTDLLQKQAQNALSGGRDEAQSGDYVNFEIAFAYQAVPGQGEKARAKNIHLLIEFFLGVYDWVHIPIPVWIQLEGLVGTIRLRLQFIPEFPFVRNVTFAFMGLPAIEASAIPMSRALPNVLDLPLVSRFAKDAIAASLAEYLAPKSMTINIQDLLSGAALGDTRALGAFVITIHHAKGLSPRDNNGKSDPYVVLAYAKFGKPLYSTRIILGDLNPCFEETTALLVTEDEVKSEEELAVMLWDSDKRSADDLVGRVEIPIKSLMQDPNKMIDRTDKLMGYEDADSMSGSLSWSIGYFSKVPLKKSLERPIDTPPSSTPPSPSRSDPQPEQAVASENQSSSAEDSGSAPDVQRTPPDPDYPSGILSIAIHHISNLERQNLKGSSGKDREGQAGQDTDTPAEEASNLPSPYCEIIINDDLIYKTRVKQYTSMPFFEAGTERFIRDWRNTLVRIVVRDARLREKDPILGIVDLDLKHLLRDASEVTRVFSITEGIGFGRINVSVLFKSIALQLPKKALGWETATVEILSPITLVVNQDTDFRPTVTKLIAFTTDSNESIPASAAETTEGGITWNIGGLRLPVYNRYSSSLTFELGKSSVWDRKPDAIAVLWLSELVDDEEIDVEVPVIIGKDLRLLRQNYLNDFTASTHDYQIVGRLLTKIKVNSGLDEDHEVHAKTEARRHAYETYDHMEGEAQVAERNAHADDDGVVDKNEKKAIQKAHKRQLANRQRGIYGFRPYRTAIWMKEGIKRRIVPAKSSKKRDPVIQSEV